ncbi:MAG: DNA repair protein RecN [Flavobacteriaceae bacterium]|nr:DNA repair protein RecN [Flavobacteriaceae bacterium]
MLTHLFVSNYALIDKLQLDFGPGLSIITGETGAGKSILLGALKLVLGSRADLSSIKDINTKCVVEAHFDISKLNLEWFFEENNLDFEEISILRREILPTGKSRAFINDVPVLLATLQTFSSFLIDIHSQFQTADLLKDSFQFNWIDAVAQQQADVQKFYHQWQEWNLNKNELKSLQEEKSAFLQEFEYNSYLFEELHQIDLRQISISELEQEQFNLENAEEISLEMSDVIQLIENEEIGVLAQLNEINSKSRFFSDSLKNRINTLRIEIKDIVIELIRDLENIEMNPQRLSEVQTQLNQINLLFQKHRVQEVEDLIQIKNELEKKLESTLQIDDTISKLKNQLKDLEEKLKTESEKIAQQRKKQIPLIEKEIGNSLQQLGMPNANLSILQTTSDHFNAFGKDSIELKFSANKGIEPKDIDKAVSGGERSRLMLAIKQSVAQHKELPTLILDEIDTGVSGKIAQSVGEIMAKAGKNLQIIAITHLPQVAALGNAHYKVLKLEKNQVTTTEVVALSEQERITEIAQMLSGKEVSAAAMEQASQLLKTQGS